MRKSKCIICALLIIVAIAAAILPATAQDSYVCGDADGDGVVSIIDATAIQRKLASLTVSNFDEKAADVNGDGLDILDATKIQRYLADFNDNNRIGELVSPPATNKPTSPTDPDEYELPFIPA